MKNVQSNISFLLQGIKKIIKIIATISQILRLKCTKIPIGRELTTLPQISQWHLMGLLLRGGKGKGGKCCRIPKNMLKIDLGLESA